MVEPWVAGDAAGRKACKAAWRGAWKPTEAAQEVVEVLA